MNNPYSDINKLKKCINCPPDNCLLSVINFSRSRKSIDGLQSVCKKCAKEYRSKYRSTNSYRKRHNARTTAWQKNNPIKTAAHILVKKAIHNGDLIRETCEKCGNPKAEAHHEDYTKPLDVTWLCVVHHKKRHAEINAEEFNRRELLALELNNNEE